MALLAFQGSTIPKLTEKYLSFDFYILDIYCDSRMRNQGEILDDVKREIDSVKDRVLFLKLRCYRSGVESFISNFRNLSKLSLYNVSLKAINSVLDALRNSNMSLKHLSISLSFKEGDGYLLLEHEQERSRITKFSRPSLISLRLTRFTSSTIIKMFDFSHIRTLKLIDCSLNDLPISDSIEELEIERCYSYAVGTMHKISLLKNLKSLKLNDYNKFLISEFIKVFLKLESLRRIRLSVFITIEAIITCLLKDNIHEVDFSGREIICYNDARSIRAMSCALCATTAKKLHLNDCTLNITMINVLRENSRWIEYISLRCIFIIDDNDDDPDGSKARKAFKDLIEYSEFRVCDIRLIKEEFVTSPITRSNIGKIIIDSRSGIVQKFSKLIELGKAIPMKSDLEVSFTRSFRDRLSERDTMLDVNTLSEFYAKYFPVYYIDTSDNMKANLREIVVIRDMTEDVALDISNPLDNRQIINLNMEDGLCIHIKPPPDRHIIIPPETDHTTEFTSDYDFTIIIRTHNKSLAEEIRIPCHKSVLSSKSEMFRAMFNIQMKESLLNEMTTDNIYYKDFIEYLYTRKISLNKENILPLIELARMHFIKDLEYKILAFIYRHKDELHIENWILEKYDLII
jgi:hypothetical protein